MTEQEWNAQCSPCPYCGGDGYLVAHVRYPTETQRGFGFVCMECRKQWTEMYTLTAHQ